VSSDSLASGSCQSQVQEPVNNERAHAGIPISRGDEILHPAIRFDSRRAADGGALDRVGSRWIALDRVGSRWIASDGSIPDAVCRGNERVKQRAVAGG